jgi:hypothetical protein
MIVRLAHRGAASDTPTSTFLEVDSLTRKIPSPIISLPSRSTLVHRIMIVDPLSIAASSAALAQLCFKVRDLEEGLG